MNKYLYIVKNTSYFLLSLLVYLIIISILSSLNILSYKTISIISFIFTILLFLIFGLKLAKTHKQKGYLMGLVSSALNLLIFIIISIILGQTITPSALIYYLILLISGAVGGMFGVNLKKTD